MPSLDTLPPQIKVRPERLLALAAALVTVVLWASAFVAIRYVGRDVSPGALSLGRLLIGSAVLGVFLLRTGWRPVTRPNWPGLLACGVLWFGGYNVALNAAERRVDAGTAAMLINIGPIIIAFLAGWLLAEGFPARLFVGSAVAFAGVLVIGTSTSASSTLDEWGVTLCVLAAAAYAIGVVAQKPVLGRLPALQVTWLACTIGAVSCLPFGSSLVRDLSEAPGAAIGWLVWLGVMPTAVAFTTWAYALSRTSAGKMGATTYLVPPLAILLAWIFLGETPPAIAIGGGLLCLAGVYISRRIAGSRRNPRD